ncbi:hypothetical protein VTK26DRAFT_5404 [Humicola hyalothermophila]
MADPNRMIQKTAASCVTSNTWARQHTDGESQFEDSPTVARINRLIATLSGPSGTNVRRMFRAMWRWLSDDDLAVVAGERQRDYELRNGMITFPGIDDSNPPERERHPPPPRTPTPPPLPPALTDKERTLWSQLLEPPRTPSGFVQHWWNDLSDYVKKSIRSTTTADTVLDGEGTPVRVINVMPPGAKGLANSRWASEEERSTGVLKLDPNRKVYAGGFGAVKD